MLARLSFSFLIAAATMMATSLDPILVGGAGYPGIGLSIPFGNDQYPAFQQLFDHGSFNGQPIDIGGLTFFNTQDQLSGHTITPADYTIRLGTVPFGTALGPDLNGNLAASSDLSYFFNGQLGGDINGQFTIVGQNGFMYDPNAGDLVLDIQQNNPAVSLNLGLDFACSANCVNPDLGMYDDQYVPYPGLSIAFSNLPEANITSDCSIQIGCTLPLGLVTQFDPVGGSQSVPVLPSISSTGSFLFDNAASGSWFDPNTAYGFHYLGLSGTLFTAITLPTGFNSPFQILDSTGNVLQVVSGGDSFSFSTPLSEFSVVNIDPLVDPTNPTAFPLQIFFANSTGDFQADPLLTPPTTGPGVPEPAPITMLTLGIMALKVVRTRSSRAAQ